MIQDYISIVAPTIAIVNSVIAVAVAQFPVGEKKWKLTLLISAVVLGLLAGGATILNQRFAVEKQEQDKSDRLSKHGALGDFIQEGGVLLQKLRIQDEPVDEAGVNAWASRVEDFLNARLGPGYLQRFRDSSGAMHGQPVAIDQKHVGYWNAVYERVSRLQQFATELAR